MNKHLHQHQAQKNLPEKASSAHQRKKLASFTKLVFSDNSTVQTESRQERRMAAKNINESCASQTDLSKPTSSTQTEPTNQETHAQTELSIEVSEIYKKCVSRVDPLTTRQKETHPNWSHPR